MEGINVVDNAEGLEGFDCSLSSDLTFNLYNTLTQDDQIKKLGEKCSDFYHISCSISDKDLSDGDVSDSDLEQRKDVPDIYKILKRFAHTADNLPLDLLICKYNDESMQEARRIIEELREKYGTWAEIKDPYPYGYMVGFFGGTAGRDAQYVIGELKSKFPEKFRELKVKK